MKSLKAILTVLLATIFVDSAHALSKCETIVLQSPADVAPFAQEVKRFTHVENVGVSMVHARPSLLWAERHAQRMIKLFESEDWGIPGTVIFGKNNNSYEDDATVEQRRDSQKAMIESLKTLETQIQNDLKKSLMNYRRLLILIDKVGLADSIRAFPNGAGKIAAVQALAESVESPHDFVKVDYGTGRPKNSQMENAMLLAHSKKAVLVPFVGPLTTDEITDLVGERIIPFGLLEEAPKFDGNKEKYGVGHFVDHDLGHALLIILKNLSEDPEESRALQMAYRKLRDSTVDPSSRSLLRLYWFDIGHEHEFLGMTRQLLRNFLKEPENRATLLRLLLRDLLLLHKYDGDFPELVVLAEKGLITQEWLDRLTDSILIEVVN